MLNINTCKVYIYNEILLCYVTIFDLLNAQHLFLSRCHMWEWRDFITILGTFFTNSVCWLVFWAIIMLSNQVYAPCHQLT